MVLMSYDWWFKALRKVVVRLAAWIDEVERRDRETEARVLKELLDMGLIGEAKPSRSEELQDADGDGCGEGQGGEDGSGDGGN